jgi:hypothetical protein
MMRDEEVRDDYGDEQIVERLRSLGSRPVPHGVAQRHLGSLPPPGGRRPVAPILVAAAVALLLAGVAAVPVAVRYGAERVSDVAQAPPEDPSETPPNVPDPPAEDPAAKQVEGPAEAGAGADQEGPPPHAGRPEHAGPHEGRGYPCTGPPPWAGQPPEGATEEERDAFREAQVRQWHEERAAARAAGECKGQPDDRPPSPGHAGSACTGPPPFAVGPPPGDTDEERAANREAQVRAWHQERAEAGCPADEDD